MTAAMVLRRLSIITTSLCVLVSSQAAAQLLIQQQDQPIPLPTACTLLAATFPGSVVTIHDQRYPTCRFYPTGAREIQEALADILIPHNVRIAVTSGSVTWGGVTSGSITSGGVTSGSVTWGGVTSGSVTSGGVTSTSVDHGITIDLARVNSTTLVDDDEAVILGVGARWGDVYQKLAAHQLTAAGSRTSDDTVGSHVLGGGISWFANERGWTCDTAMELQVVTPQGQILWANPHWNDDLFWASKGTLGALGIVTQIKLPTVKARPVYGGITSHAPKHVPLLFSALQTTILHANEDPAQAAYMTLDWTPTNKDWSYHAYLLNTRHQAHNVALDAFMHIPSLDTTLRTTTLLSSAQELAAHRHQQSFHGKEVHHTEKFTLTAKSSTKTMQAIHDLITAYTSSILHKNSNNNDDDDNNPSPNGIKVTYQPLTTAHLLSASINKNPPSPLTPAPIADAPLLIISVEISFPSPSPSSSSSFPLSTWHQSLHTALTQQLSSLNALHPFIYPPDASPQQNPYGRHILSRDRRAWFNAVRKRYDPDGIWEKLSVSGAKWREEG